MAPKRKEDGFNFEKLEVYQRTINFVENIYKITKQFPKAEQFGTISQLRRATLSIALNIAEGTGRYYSSEKRQFYRMARSSIHECVPLLKVSFRQGYIDKNIHDENYQECIELARMVSGLISALHYGLEKSS